MLQIIRIVDDLPKDFEILRQEAADEGWHHLHRLADEWKNCSLRYDGEGEALLAAFEDSVIAAIGAVCIEPK